VINAEASWDALKRWGRSKTPPTEDLIRNLRGLTKQSILAEVAGSYRPLSVFIRGFPYVPPNSLCVPEWVATFLTKFSERRSKIHPIVFAANAHIEFTAIHPFFDGNGRTSRLLVNASSLRDGCPPASYPAMYSAETYSALYIAPVGSLRSLLRPKTGCNNDIGTY